MGSSLINLLLMITLVLFSAGCLERSRSGSKLQLKSKGIFTVCLKLGDTSKYL